MDGVVILVAVGVVAVFGVVTIDLAAFVTGLDDDREGKGEGGEDFIEGRGH
jgi:hypothetical protein